MRALAMEVINEHQPKKVACSHNQGWTFEKIDGGMKRTCKICGKTITEMSKRGPQPDEFDEEINHLIEKKKF